MRKFILNNWHTLGLAFIFICAEIIVSPIGDFCLNDDWGYAKAVLTLHNEGRIDIGDWCGVTLFTQIIWGALFTKIFGFSLSILRISTLVSSLIGVIFMNRLVNEISGNKLIGFLASLTLLLNPLYFNLSNTFMTDVHFNTLLVVASYAAYRFFITRQLSWFIVVFVLSALLVLLRQFGIIVPLAFTAACYFLPQKKWIYIIPALLSCAAVYLILHVYQGYLKTILGPYTLYQFTSRFNLTDKAFYVFLYDNFKFRYSAFLLHVLVYSFPLALFFLPDLLSRFKLKISALVTILSVIIIYFVFRDERFPLGNIFTNMGVGAETFYESLKPGERYAREHTYSEDFAKTCTAVKYIFGALTLITIVLAGINFFKYKGRVILKSPGQLFLIILFLAYFIILIVPDGIFDRYTIPLITMALILVSFIPAGVKYYSWPSFFVLLVFFYVSVFGTKDYLVVNTEKWKAYYYLKNEKHIDAAKINAGFEVAGWNDGKHSWWYDFFTLDPYNYLVQYRPQEGFKPVKTIIFRRYFPIKTDSITIYERMIKSPIDSVQVQAAGDN